MIHLYHAHADSLGDAVTANKFTHGNKICIDHVFRVFRDQAAGIHGLDQLDMSHNDFKLDNCVLTSSSSDPRGYELLIADLGLTTRPDQDISADCGSGTPGYRAPEVTKGGRNTAKADVWSLGVGVMVLWLNLSYEEILKLDADPCADCQRHCATSVVLPALLGIVSCTEQSIALQSAPACTSRA